MIEPTSSPSPSSELLAKLKLAVEEAVVCGEAILQRTDNDRHPDPLLPIFYAKEIETLRRQLSSIEKLDEALSDYTEGGRSPLGSFVHRFSDLLLVTDAWIATLYLCDSCSPSVGTKTRNARLALLHIDSEMKPSILEFVSNGRSYLEL